ncbi:GatB/YqeY domain-containing protein [Candidatus Peregrinibacteria bacterium]|nr:GatB/YqeY domain-containing protein [Candidatus Peregrinibacteria bacterium]
MALKNTIQDELKKSMLAKDETRTSVLRMLKADIMKFEVSGDRKEATDADILQLVQKGIKSRRDSAEQFRNGGREEQAAAEEKEIEVLMEFMPPQMDEQEILELAKAAIAETGAESKADMGKVMGALMPKVQGKADGTLVSKIVNELLG